MWMQPLIQKEPKRIFTFGCSFTKYLWGTWANILGAEFPQAKFYNLGRPSAGNQYIHNVIMQVDNIYNFCSSDLVIVQWSNVYREDRYFEDAWRNSGNIFFENYYPKKFVEDYFDMYGAYVRDFALIKSAWCGLKDKTQVHMIKMKDFDHPSPYKELQQQILDLSELYAPTLDAVHPSIMKTLWNNDLDSKFERDEKLVHPLYKDGHPSPAEHFDYLKKTFTHDWSEATQLALDVAQHQWVELMRLACDSGYKTRETNIDGYRFNEYLQTLKINNKHFLRGSDEPDERLHRQ
jgi:hypothetical protein